jgi:hypothetical protein
MFTYFDQTPVASIDYGEDDCIWQSLKRFS